MAHIYKVSEWESPSGKWRCNDVQDLTGISGKWWVPARMLGFSLTGYILFLQKEFNANIEEYYEPTDLLLFSFDNYADCHKYVLYINKIARNKNFLV